MISRLQTDRFEQRTPISLHMKNGVLYCQLQVDVARDDGLRGGFYCEHSKIDINSSFCEIGNFIFEVLRRFHELGDMPYSKFLEITGGNKEEYDKKKLDEFLGFIGAKTSKDVYLKYESCSISANVNI